MQDFWREAFLPSSWPKYTILTEFVTSDQLERSVTSDTSRHQGTGTCIVYNLKKLWWNENFENVLPVGHFQVSAFHDPNFTVFTEFFLNDHLERSMRNEDGTRYNWNTKSSIPKKKLWKTENYQNIRRHFARLLKRSFSAVFLTEILQIWLNFWTVTNQWGWWE